MAKPAMEWSPGSAAIVMEQSSSFPVLYLIHYWVICYLLWQSALHTISTYSAHIPAVSFAWRLKEVTRTRSFSGLESCLATRPSKRSRSIKSVRFSRFEKVFNTYSPDEYDRKPVFC
ncbi:hypothetical protein K493DRAFT_319784 [Basidiobolus meristosporus CBS 931.73]|uniref:Uncharacterized protein n=1 Tax=Basidiobolus meristosporus CBS 931.73 TaxID=1314790 RepID=A0A1Y1XL38_9FUNG|nr:hypothetical protein K493DRAFT_319784 [Basidiobolus meristosporus CBS 931.73]|eukprot:ORX86479.1 hypothetical protein K493DRAFT_319784 [Basidiobolus meristosporus CBS 931.73]